MRTGDRKLTVYWEFTTAATTPRLAASSRPSSIHRVDRGALGLRARDAFDDAGFTTALAGTGD